MAVHDLYSKRLKREQGEIPDVYSYDDIPVTLREQIFQIWRNDIKARFSEESVKILRREYGVRFLYLNQWGNSVSYFEELCEYFFLEKEVLHVLDVIELTFKLIEDEAKAYAVEIIKASVAEVIEELNIRFREHGVGYRYEHGKIHRLDSEFIHQETVKPALQVLASEDYRGSQEEFLSAHDHYRKGDLKEAINKANMAFESTLQTVCQKRNWPVKGSMTAGNLVGACIRDELIPDYWRGHMDHLKNILKSGVPSARNEIAAHGQGAEPNEVSEHVTAYVLHMTAAAIVFLAHAEQAHDQQGT